MLPLQPIPAGDMDEEAEDYSFLGRQGLPTISIPRRFSDAVPEGRRSHTEIRPRLSVPQMRLHVSIPALPATIKEDNTPLTSESPELETPASVTSPIAGVVDLTKSVTTTSPYAVAQGGLSDIYKGEWYRTDGEGGAREKVTVAIKLLRVLEAKDSDGVRARRKLNREVYVWHRLEHPNVVKLFGTSYHMSGRPAMVMQWYHHGSAVDYLANTKPGVNFRMQLILDVARGLEYLHTHQPPIVHADLKGVRLSLRIPVIQLIPKQNNVLITDEGRAALSDFGLSQVVDDLGRPAGIGLTLSNPNVGPLRWQAPELSNDEEPPKLASDVWSFGCTAFELLTNCIPYPNRTRDAQVIRDMQKFIKPSGSAETTVLALDPSVGALLDACWRFNPAERLTMTEVRMRLEAICAARPTQTTP